MQQYLDLLRDILDNGNTRGDRTGTGTRSVFGRQLRFDLSKGFPLLTTKKMHLRSIIHELLWFIAGDTNNETLKADGVSIWDEWALPEDETVEVRIPDPKRAWLLMDKLGVNWDETLRRLNIADFTARHTEGWNGDERAGGKALLAEHGIPETETRVRIRKGELGPIYGHQWRSWIGPRGVVVDQLRQVIDSLKTNPWSRRHIVSAWNPVDLPDESISPQENVRQGKMALAPCHCLFQFYVTLMSVEERIKYAHEHGSQMSEDAIKSAVSVDALLTEFGIPDKKLSCQLYQRSADTLLGVPYNIASYALLTHMVAQVCGMAVGEFVWTGGDVHLYANHFEQAQLQLTREPMPLPTLWLNPEITDIEDFRFEDIEVRNYQSHRAISAPISV